MKKECLTSLLAAISLLSTVAQAEVIQGTFSGVVTSATGTADGVDLTTLVGLPITGKFSYDSTTMLYIPLSAGGCDPAYCGSFASDPVTAPITMTNTVAGHTFRVTGTSYSDLHVDIAGGIYTTNFFRLNSQNVPFGTPRPGDNACEIIIGLTNYGGPPFMSDRSDSGTVNFVYTRPYLNASSGSIQFCTSNFAVLEFQPLTATAGPASVDDLLAALAAEVAGVGPGKSLANKVALAQVYYAVPDVQATCAVLTGFVNEVKAQAGKKKLTAAQATKFTSDANAIMAAIGCD